MNYIVRADQSIFALHPQSRTMFLTFKHKEHALDTQCAIRHFVMAHRTLPLTYPNSGIPIQLRNPEDWSQIIKNTFVDEMSESDIMSLCKVHSAGRLHVTSMQRPQQLDYNLDLNFECSVYDGEDMDIDTMRNYLEYISA